MALWTEAASFKPLAVMRIILGAVLLAQAHVLWTYRDILLNPAGPVPWEISDAWVHPMLPKISSLLPWFAAAGIGAGGTIATVLGVHAIAAAFLMVGYRTRASVIVAWLTFVLIKNSSFVYTYGLGAILLIALFYSVFMPISREWSLDRALKPPAADAPAGDASMYVVMFRLHVCIIYAASGFSKAMGDQWWAGDALWRALSLPQFRQFDPAPLLAWPAALQLASVVVIVAQLAYPVLVWTRLRAFIVVVTELFHLGIGLFLGLWLFSAMMIALNIAAFGEAVWTALSGRARRGALPDVAAAGTGLRIIYDGACPFCDDYVRYQRLRASAGHVELVDARSRPEVLAEHAIDPAELEEGMVVVMDGRLHRGADAMHLLSMLSESPGKAWVRAIAALSRSRPLARLAYPFLRLGRRIALALLGVPRFPRG